MGYSTHKYSLLLIIINKFYLNIFFKSSDENDFFSKININHSKELIL